MTASMGFRSALSRVVVIAGANNSGLFLYLGQPGAGKLILSLTPAAGTDPYGNTYGEGISLSTVANTADPGMLNWLINKVNAASIGQRNNGTNDILTIRGPKAIGIINLWDNGQVDVLNTGASAGVGMNIENFGTAPLQLLSGGDIWLQPGTATNVLELGPNGTGFHDEQHGTFSVTFSATSAATGTLTFPVAFVKAPVINGTVQVGSNLDILMNWQTVSATAATWRLFQKSGSSVTGTPVVHWWAVA